MFGNDEPFSVASFVSAGVASRVSVRFGVRIANRQYRSRPTRRYECSIAGDSNFHIISLIGEHFESRLCSERTIIFKVSFTAYQLAEVVRIDILGSKIPLKICNIILQERLVKPLVNFQNLPLSFAVLGESRES